MPGIDEKYEILDRISSGGRGSVYRAMDRELQRVVALKSIFLGPNPDPFYIAAVQQDTFNLARLNHPNVIGILDLFIEDQTLWLVMEFISSDELHNQPQDLAAYVGSNGGRLPWRRAAEIGGQIARGLQHCHDQGVVHRDIKPSNILLDSNGDAVLADFGSSLLLNRGEAGGDDRSQPRFSQTFPHFPQQMDQTNLSILGGTPLYMPPEQWIGEGIDQTSDQYSLGVTLFELVVGRQPFVGNSIIAIMQSHTESPLPQLPIDLDIPVSLEEVIRTSTNKEKSQRYPSAGDMADAIASVLSEHIVQLEEDIDILGVLDGPPLTDAHTFHFLSPLSQLDLTDTSSTEDKDETKDRIDNFRFEIHSNQGGNGNIFLGSQMGTRDNVLRRIALKIMPVMDTEQFSQANSDPSPYDKDLVPMRFNHPNLITYYDTGILKPEEIPEGLQAALRCSTSGRGGFTSHPIRDCEQMDLHSHQIGWIAMELSEAGSLADLARRRFDSDRPYGIDAILEIVRQILIGVGRLHNDDCMHRDLKPGNVLFFRDGPLWKVSDFDWSGMIDAEGFAGTKSGTFGRGTPGWSAPEQIAGRPVRFTADIYSIGQIMYYLLTGKYAFRLPETTPPPPSSFNTAISDTLSQVVLKCVSWDPTNRYPKTEAVLEALSAV